MAQWSNLHVTSILLYLHGLWRKAYSAYFADFHMLLVWSNYTCLPKILYQGVDLSTKQENVKGLCFSSIITYYLTFLTLTGTSDTNIRDFQLSLLISLCLFEVL